HTRFSRDWSSDVCSSDLRKPTLWLIMESLTLPTRTPSKFSAHLSLHCPPCHRRKRQVERYGWAHFTGGITTPDLTLFSGTQSAKIGRASCRERGQSTVRT